MRSLKLLSRYKEICNSNPSFVYDKYQVQAISTLETMGERILAQGKPLKTLHQSRPSWNFLLGTTKPSSITQPNSPQGVYLYGGVGCGKTMVMDMFYETLKQESIKTSRTHFHSFMLDVHDRLHRLRYNPENTQLSDPLPIIAREIVQEHWVICFDEMLVLDVADAMILRHLFGSLIAEGAFFVATSNAAPTDLYHNGINRELFLPFIKLIHEKFTVHKMNSPHDYRSMTGKSQKLSSSLTDKRHQSVIAAAGLEGVKAERKKIVLGSGREFEVDRCYKRGEESVCVFDFEWLFGQKVASSAAEYIAIGSTFDTIVIENFPQLKPNQLSMCRRFMVALDLWYDLKVDVLIGAMTGPDYVFRLLEEAELGLKDKKAQFNLIGEGGSSGRSTATFKVEGNDDVIEWSGTGLTDVSLHEFGRSRRDEELLFKRATSRLRQLYREDKFFVIESKVA